MASRSHTTQDNTGACALSQSPPTISLASHVLASVITLPDNPCIAYSVFTSVSTASSSEALSLLDTARRSVLLCNGKTSVLDSLLPSVHISKDSSALYVFAVASAEQTSLFARLNELQFNGLILSETFSFKPTDIYPCSITCATQRIPCSNCLNHSSISFDTPQSSALLLPRQCLRLPYFYFLQAVRSRLIDDIAEASKLNGSCRSVTRLKDGFVLGTSNASSEWGSGWEHHSRNRPFIHCQLQIHLSQSSSTTRLMIHPILRPTYYLPLHRSLPLPAGTPIVLLPHGVPAYYLTTYAGPSAALTAQFEDALLGHGAGNWKQGLDGRKDSSKDSVTYIIAWLAVQNKQGEDKGIPLIWPIQLCLSYHQTSPSLHARTPLKHIPELAAQLQASPPPPAPPSISFSGVIPSPLSGPSPSDASSSHDLSQSFTGVRRTSLTSSPTSRSLRAFRTMTLSAKPNVMDIRQVAAEVSGYVDAVAKERERERERIRREREGKDKDKESGSMKEHTAPAHVAASSSNTPFMPAEIVSAISLPLNPETTEHSVVDARVEQAPGQTSEAASPAMEDISSQDNSMTGLFSPPEVTLDELPANLEDIAPLKTEPDDMAVDSKDGIQENPVESASDSFFGPFYDSSWKKEDEFMDMNVNYNMGGYQMDLASLGGERENASGTGVFDDDNGFGVFTEDDFDFFDGPPVASRGTASAPHISAVQDRSSGMALAGPAPLGLSPQILGDAIGMAGPGPPSAMHSQSSPWAPPPLGEAFVPRITELSHFGHNMLVAPELLPPTPGKTPSAFSAPATPAVQLSDTIGGTRSGTLAPGFDPIPFAPSHKAADGKYTVGKFALPSPPDEEDRTESMDFSSSSSSKGYTGWKKRYFAATDPRVGVVRKLIGVKRKGFAQRVQDVKRSPAWMREHEEWECPPSPVLEDSKSDADSDDEPWMDEDDARTVSRPSTPPPSYLPMGPSLLHTQFHHSHLLPLSSPLRHPSLAVGNMTNGAAPISVPTPVSPAAVLGAASEKSKSLEAAVQILVKEMVENSVWAEAWQANATNVHDPADVRQSDVKKVVDLFSAVVGVQSPLDLETLANSDLSSTEPAGKLQLQDPPMLAIGKSDVVVHVLPTALRFWEKLGLSPRSGQKNVTAFVFFESSGDEREAQMEQWLNHVSATYSAKNYGTHSAGLSDSCVRPGLVPVHFDAFRKTLVNFVSTLPLPHPHLVFYIITPPSILSLTSPVLRQLLSAVKRALKTHAEAHLLIQFVPEELTSGIVSDPRASHSGLEPFVDSIYERVLQPVERAVSRKLFTFSAHTTEAFHAPAFVLAPPSPSQDHGKGISLPVSFVLDPHPRSLDVLDRYALLHVGYQISPCGKWILASCIDSRGEAHDLGAWLITSDGAEGFHAFVVNRVWSFVSDFARRAHVEWRIVIAKLGAMGSEELDAWIRLLDSIGTPPGYPPTHVTLLTVDRDNPWTFLPPANKRPTPSPTPSSSSLTHIRSAGRNHQGAVFADVSSATYALYSHCSPSLVSTFVPNPPPCIPDLATGHSGIPGCSDPPFIPDCEDERTLSVVSNPTPGFNTTAEEVHTHISLLGRARGTSTLVFIPAGNDYLPINMLRLVRLHVARVPGKLVTSTGPVVKVGDEKEQGAIGMDGFEEQTMKDITRNFYELAVLARIRWKLGGRTGNGLPFHLAALDTMRMVLATEME